jgi:hypothetical protein
LITKDRKEENMKKTFIVLAMVVAMSFGLIGCSDDNQPRENGSFVKVENGDGYDIVYHKDTKVMYIVGCRYLELNYEVMLNADGSPMLYEED